MSPVEKVLSHLHRVKRTAPNRWQACCPAHDDGSPSLNLRELDDGRLLLHCFGGCSVHEVLGALGLQMVDLFPDRPHQPGDGRKPERRPFNATDLADLTAWESSIAAIISSDIINGKEGADFDRLLLAANRLASVAEAVHAGR